MSMPTRPAASTASVVVPITRLVARMAPILWANAGEQKVNGGLLWADMRHERPPSATRPPSMRGGAFCGGFVVEHDQGVDGDAGFRIDQERIDIDRGDAVARV